MEKFNFIKENGQEAEPKKEVSITLPINPRHYNKLGFYGIFAYLNSTANTNMSQDIIMLNTRDGGNEENKLELIKKIELLGIKPKNIIEDNNIEDGVSKKVFERLLNKGIIRVSEEQISRCKCGKMQFKAEAKLYRTSTSLLSQDGTAKCCGSTLETKVEKVVVTSAIKRPSKLPEFYPKTVQKEIDWFYENTNHELLLSRETEQKYSVEIDNNKYFIDPDNLMYFYLLYLDELGYKVKELVSGISTVKQVAYMLSFCEMAEVDLPNKISFLPRIDFKGSDNEYIEKYLEKFGNRKILNALLWATSGSKQTVNMSEDFIKRSSGENVDNPHLYENRQKLIPQG